MSQGENLKQLVVTAAQQHKSGNIAEAEKLYREFLKFVPDEVHVMNYLGRALADQEKFPEAETVFKKAAEKHPSYPETFNNMGRMYIQQKKFSAAKDYFHKALSLSPDNHMFLYNYGNMLLHFGEYSQAIEHYKKSLAIEPDFTQAYFNLANAAMKMNDADTAETACLKLLKIDPNYVGAYECLGRIYDYNFNFSKMIDIYEKLLQLVPNHPYATGQLVMPYQYTCNWEKWDYYRSKVKEINDTLIDEGKPAAVRPFVSMMSCTDPEENLKVARSHCLQITEEAKNTGVVFSLAGRQKAKEKLVIGYMSADIRNHTAGNIMQYMFAEHDSNNFEIHLYATTSDDGSEVRKRSKESCNKFFDCHNMTDIEIAQLIYDNKTDILVDLTGHMSDGRLLVSALRPAPIHVSMWCYPGTTGADFIDYIIADKITIPAEHQQYYSEKCAYLPITLQGNHDKEKMLEEKLSKKDFGIDENCFVFNAHHSSYKINKEIFDVWLKLLKRVDNSVIWLRYLDDVSKNNLLSYAKESGIDPARILFSDRIDREKYFKRLSLMDLGLDTTLYNGGSTTMDCLWAGLPIVTMLGTNYTSRMGASIINGIGLYDELVTNSLTEYEEKAFYLATNPEALKELKNKLWQRRAKEKLFNMGKCVSDLERAYKEMWDIYSLNRKPEVIELC